MMCITSDMMIRETDHRITIESDKFPGSMTLVESFDERMIRTYYTRPRRMTNEELLTTLKSIKSEIGDKMLIRADAELDKLIEKVQNPFMSPPDKEELHSL